MGDNPEPTDDAEPEPTPQRPKRPLPPIPKGSTKKTSRKFTTRKRQPKRSR
jgi:hypothetical protein